MRNSFYCIYQGNVYHAGGHNNETITLTSRNSLDLMRGFTPYYRDESLYVLEVPLQSLERYFRVTSTVVYKGEHFQVACTSDALVAIVTNNPIIAHDFNMEQTDKYEFKKWVPLEDVTILEEEEDIELPITNHIEKEIL